MKVVYAPRYVIDIGTHVFDTGKYARVRHQLLSRGLLSPADFVEPEPARWDDLSRVHTPEYLEKTRSGGFRPWELATLELPWSPEVAEGFRLMAGGTILAARLAVGSGGGDVRATPALRAAANLGGGFHHAFPAHGEGFCLYNDVAVAIRALQAGKTIGRAAVLDLDVHQGNGTAFCFEGEPEVFTCSVHQEHTYPFVKPRGSCDIGLPDGADDRTYQRALAEAIPAAIGFRPDLLFYVAGADPFAGDELGGLSLTLDGLRRRDRLVLEAARDARVPVVIVLAGGYASRPEDTVAIHAATIEEALRLGA
jgi:acetoin utilization deacetylase AcuC-like enzyme